MSISLFSIFFSIAPSAPVDTVRLRYEAASAFWFDVVKYAGYAVAVGCAMEAPETFVLIKRWWLLKFRDVEKEETKEDRKSWIVPVAAAGLIIIVAGIVVETFAEGKVSNADALLRSHESEKISKAEGEAAEATTSAGTAAVSAITAHQAAVTAKSASDKAVTASGTAFTLATGARKEADSYAQEIAGAKRQAADAVSQLADAERRLADSTEREAEAEAKLSAIKTPRSLVHTDELVRALKPFQGTVFVFNVFMDDESSRFMQPIAAALKEAGWIRQQPPGMNLGVPTLSIRFDGSDNPEMVPSCIDTGISVHVSEMESLGVLNSKPFASLPQTLRAAITLTQVIGASISPPDEKNVNVGVLDPKPGEEKPIIICVGKKP